MSYIKSFSEFISSNRVNESKTVEDKIKGLARHLAFDKDIIKPWKEGKSLRYLADIYHTSRTTLSEKLKNLGYNIKNKQIESRIPETIFDSIDTEEKAYWLGFIYADGNIKTVTKKI